MKHFNNKVAAITGAGSGIGQQLAVALAKEGCALALSDINPEGLEKTLSLVAEYAVKTTTTTLDVSQKEAVYAWADAVQKDHGQVNFIFNNAGVAMSNTVESHSIEDYEWMMGINFWGVVYGTKAFLPYLKASGAGHIINISSIFGLMSQPTQSAYNASKFAVRGFTESLRQELDMLNCGVSTTCVHPGGIRTNIANAARISDKISILGVDAAKSSKEFNKLLRTPPLKAAEVILAGVKNNDRRVLIGGDAYAADMIQRVLPTAYQKIIVAAARLSAKRNR